MRLKDILKDIQYEIIQGNINIEINGIENDSRKVKKNYLFISIFGFNQDGHKYINKAIDNGANCIIICKDIIINNEDICIIKVSDTKLIECKIAMNYYNNPQNKLIKIGITGTKGKTTTSFMIKRIIETRGYKCGLIGTTGIYINDKYYITNNTTPDGLEIIKYMDMMVKDKIKYVVMEISSQALKYNRVNNIIFDYGIFTNLSKDHIGNNEHTDMNDYINSKSKLFKQSINGIFNIDDKHYLKMIDDIKYSPKTYGFNNQANLKIDKVEYLIDHKNMKTKITTSGIINNTFLVNMPGIYNAYNACSAILTCYLLGININDIKKCLKNISVKGRTEIINLGNSKIIIDYAHNGNSAENILKTVREYKPKRIITLFGCGGNRSKDRRYEMGEVVSKYSDLCIITEDNNRYEEFNDIANDILIGINKNKCKYKIINNREDAIKYVIKNRKKGDIILLLGKGHEDYIEIKGKKYHFDEREIINNIINKKI